MPLAKGIPNYYKSDFGMKAVEQVATKVVPQISKPISSPTISNPITVKSTQPKGFWSKASDVLNMGSSAVEKFGTKLFTGGKYSSYDTALDAAGLKNTKGKLDVNDVISTAGRMILDPLNLVPFSKIFKGAGAVAKMIPGASKVAKAVDTGADIIKSLPIVKKAGNMFVKGYGLSDDVVKTLDNIPTIVGSKADEVIKARKALYKGMNDDEIAAVAKFLEPQGAGAGTDLGLLRSQLGKRFDEVIKPALKYEKSVNQAEVLDAAMRGNLKPGVAKELYTNPYLYHYTEKPKESIFGKIKELFTPTKEGVSTKTTAIVPTSKFKLSGEYWKKRTGSDFSLNAPLVQTKRQLAQVKDNAIQDAITKITDKYGVKLGEGQALPEGFKYLKVPSGTEALLKKFKGIAVPKNIAGYIEQSYHQSGSFAKAMDKLNSVWKPLATSYNPSFTLNNMIGNMYNSFLGGVKNPKRFAQMMSPRPVKFTDAEEALIKQSGLIAKSEFAGDVAKEAFGKKNAGSFINKAVTGLNRNVENNARKALFLDAYEKTGSIEKAAATVDKFLFDYQSSLTPFEQNVMKRIFPFYTWARNNIPLQAKSVLTQTGKPAAVVKLIKAANGGEMPEDLSIPTPFKNAEGKKIKYTPALPIRDLANLFSETNTRDMTSPFIKMAISGLNYAAGGEAPTDYYTGKQLTNKNLPKSEQARDLFGSYAKSLIKWARTAEKIKSDKTAGNALRSIVGGFSTVQSPESAYRGSLYKESDKQKAIRSEITKSIKSGDIKRAKRLEKLLGK